MTDKRPSSAKLRRACFEANKFVSGMGTYLVCHICGGMIWPAKDAWEAEHVVRRCLSGDDSASNLKPAHVKCHKVKTAVDVSENAKGKRVSDKHFGIRKKTAWGGKLRKKMDGSVVER
jgi:5-methylcytosine-specific restriction endonuclease McrA